MENATFYPFPPFPAEEWKEKINQDLKDTTFTDLLWQKHGLEGKPFYTADDLPQNLADVAHTDAFGHRSWVNYQTIEVDSASSANRKALEVLQQGADGLIFRCSERPQLTVLLKDILMPHCALTFQWRGEVDLFTFHQELSDYINWQGYAPSTLKGFVSGQRFTNLIPLRSYVAEVKNDLPSPLALALTLAQVVDDMDRTEGLHPKDCFHHLQMHLTLTHDYFFEIARLRAIRAVVTRLAQAYELNLSPGEVQIFCQIGPWEEALGDPNGHMLQATSQAMSAVLGGADGIHVHPFYTAFPNKPLMAERLARNISGIITEESHLDKVLDPAEGAYYLEHMTHQLIVKSLSLLQEIEEQGGLSVLDKATFISKNS